MSHDAGRVSDSEVTSSLSPAGSSSRRDTSESRLSQATDRTGLSASCYLPAQADRWVSSLALAAQAAAAGLPRRSPHQQFELLLGHDYTLLYHYHNVLNCVIMIFYITLKHTGIIMMTLLP
jgi:hypothetical protein